MKKLTRSEKTSQKVSVSHPVSRLVSPQCNMVQTIDEKEKNHGCLCKYSTGIYHPIAGFCTRGLISLLFFSHFSWLWEDAKRTKVELARTISSNEDKSISERGKNMHINSPNYVFLPIFWGVCADAAFQLILRSTKSYQWSSSGEDIGKIDVGDPPWGNPNNDNF